MSNETPVERFTASRHILENRELVDDYVECVLAADYDKLKAERDEARAALAEATNAALGGQALVDSLRAELRTRRLRKCR